MTGVHVDDGNDDEDDGDVGVASKDGFVLSNIHILPIMLQLAILCLSFVMLNHHQSMGKLDILPIMPQLAMSEPVHC